MTDAIAVYRPTVGDEIRQLRDNDLAMLTTFQPSQKLEALAAMSNSTPLAEQQNKTFDLEHIVIHEVTINADGDEVDAETGEVSDTIQAKRTVLVDKDGNAYHAISKGIDTSIRNILGVAGDPSTWDGYLPVTVKQEGTGNRKYLTLKPGSKFTPRKK